jgi:UDP-glucose 4-epimerase
MLGARSLPSSAVKALVTGGAGFIGSNLTRALLARGDEVRVLDNFSTGRRSNLAGIEDSVELIEGELRSYERVHNAVRGIDVVFHQGALPSVPRSIQDPLTTSAVNIDGTLNVLLAARDEGVRRVMFASSSSVYGDSGTLPRSESAPVDPIAPYAVAKLAAESYCVSFSRVYGGLETVCLRYFNVFGPHQDPRSQYAAVVPRFIAAAIAGDVLPIYGDGLQSRDFTYVGNVVDANLRAAEADGVSGHVFNIATGSPTSVNDLADMIGATVDRDVRKEYLPIRAGEVRDSWADTEAAKRLLGWEPRIGLEEGLRLTAEPLLEAMPTLAD